jgi:hypothetical protein
MSDLLTDLLGFIDTDQLAYVEEAREGLNRGRLVQGNPEFEKNPDLNQTVIYKGGIGLSIEGLAQPIIDRGTIVTISDRDFLTFLALDVVVLTSARIRRFYAEVEGNQRLACGTNQDGQNAKGWRGMACKACEYYPKNYDGDKQDACKADVAALVYLPELDHVTILSFHGASYMEATAWLDQIGKLSRAFAQRPEVQAATPGLPRVNPWFFKTTLSAGDFEKGNDNNKFQRLRYTKAEQPYDWSKVLNTPATLKRVKEVWADLETLWKQMYVDHNSNAVMALPSAEAVTAAITAQSSAPLPPARQIESKVTVAQPAQATLPAQAALQATQQAPVQTVAAASTVPGVTTSTITLDDMDDVTQVMGF